MPPRGRRGGEGRGGGAEGLPRVREGAAEGPPRGGGGTCNSVTFVVAVKATESVNSATQSRAREREGEMLWFSGRALGIIAYCVGHVLWMFRACFGMSWDVFRTLFGRCRVIEHLK